MAFTDDTKDAALDAMTALGTYISLHDGDPSTSGANEAAGVDRVATTWGGASAGIATGSQVTFADSPANHYTYYGVWDASTTGTFCWGLPLDPGVTLDDIGDVLVTPRVTFP